MTPIGRSQARREILTGKEAVLAMAATATAAFGAIAPPLLDSNDADYVRPESDSAFWRYFRPVPYQKLD